MLPKDRCFSKASLPKISGFNWVDNVEVAALFVMGKACHIFLPLAELCLDEARYNLSMFVCLVFNHRLLHAEHPLGSLGTRRPGASDPISNRRPRNLASCAS